MAPVPTIKLSSGYEMPQVGFGLWKVDNPVAADAVYNAIKAGYRLFDGACGKLLPARLSLHHSHLAQQKDGLCAGCGAVAWWCGALPQHEGQGRDAMEQLPRPHHAAFMRSAPLALGHGSEFLPQPLSVLGPSQPTVPDSQCCSNDH